MITSDWLFLVLGNTFNGRPPAAYMGHEWQVLAVIPINLKLSLMDEKLVYG
jgi:hypothetical protein